VDIAASLSRLGLEQYEPAFRANRIEADVLPSLTAEDLKDLGVTLVGDRRRLLGVRRPLLLLWSLRSSDRLPRLLQD
jgi:hypothetical protein